MEIDSSIIIGAIISLGLWFVKSQSDRRYKEQNDVNKQVETNTKNILENKVRDELSLESFEDYKKSIDGDFKKTENMLTEILRSLNSFKDTINKRMGDLAIEIEKLKK